MINGNYEILNLKYVFVYGMFEIINCWLIENKVEKWESD